MRSADNAGRCELENGDRPEERHDGNERGMHVRAHVGRTLVIAAGTLEAEKNNYRLF